MSKKNLLHIGIIPDGNRRWARQKGLDRLKGHTSAIGQNKFKDLIKIAKKYDVKFLTFWGFSTENWKRSKQEKKHLFNLFEKVLDDFKNFFHEEEIKFRHFGRKDRIPKKLLEKINNLEKSTKNYSKFNLNLCIDYGGRDEIIRAINKVLKIKKDKIDENEFKRFLDTREIPDLDIIIRTSGEKRLSGFLPFQGVYSELFFIEKKFPDFEAKDLEQVILSFKKRDRRFGGD